ncbi:MAG: SDR family oxidoreductase [Pseudomonadota bacterium]
MNKLGHMLVVGATGLVGYAAARHFSATGWQVTAVSRRRPEDLAGAAFAAVDLADATQCAAAFSAMPDVTHVVFAAYAEQPGTQGWRDPAQMEFNLAMLRNVMEPLLAAATGLQHVTLLQGTKAYGAPLSVIPIPARERAPRAPHAAFYWLQEDWLRERQRQQQRAQPWHWTILRPQIIFGESLGSHMNIIPAIGAYAALLRQAGEPLYFPGGVSWVREAVDASLLARACEWAATSAACRNETFNITNGDVFEWRNAWPAIADALGMQPGPDRPLALGRAMPARQDEWAALVRGHCLTAPQSLEAFVGQGFLYADRQFCHGMTEAPPARLVSTIKARQAGFADCIDTEDMFRRCFARFQERGWLPARNAARL